MGPRSCERGNPSEKDAALLGSRALQWGRARASAEIPPRGVHHEIAAVASMGPRSCERGNDRVRDFDRTSGALLQWGRARASAEIVRRIDTGHMAERRFNGAALVRARKSDPAQRARIEAVLLQWGRARASAEMPNIGPRILSILASMGPRSCERGNKFVARPRISTVYPLQWGRARASAEIALLHALSDAQNKGFNGAALVRARK